MDRGYSIGMHTFFPRSKIKAYLGMIPSNIDNQLSPTSFEIKSLVVPDIFCVMGKGLENAVTKVNKDQKVSIAPAFRFSHVWNKEMPINLSLKNILIALPEHISTSVKILKQASSFIDSHKELDLNFFLKFHPDWPKVRWKKKFEDRWDQFFVENDSLEKIIFNKDLLVTGNGSTGLEAIACNEFNNAILYFMERNSNFLSRIESTGESIRLNYFEPISREAVLRFLSIK